MRSVSLVKYVALLALAPLVAACGDDGMQPEDDVTVAAQSGGGQSAAVSTALPNPFIVRVSQGGSPVSGASVSWAVTAGGGSVNPTSSTTGADGLASTVLTLGSAAGANTVQATVSGAVGSPVSFTATATGGTAPTSANVSVGDNFFDPTATTIAAGGQVTWTWAGSASHNVTFSTGSNSATQTSGTFNRTFPTAGTFNYQCTVHGASMSGTVTVQS